MDLDERSRFIVCEDSGVGVYDHTKGQRVGGGICVFAEDSEKRLEGASRFGFEISRYKNLSSISYGACRRY